MAMSYYSNWEALQHQQTQPDLATELLGFGDNFNLSNTCIDPIFEADDFFYPDHLLTCMYPSDSLPEMFPLPEFEPYPCPKRPKTFVDGFNPGLYDGMLVPNTHMLPEFSAELLVPVPEFHSPPVYHGGSTVESVKKAGGGSMSAQSMAARQRRRKISEKTQELGKLVPGGQKLNTAEMFSAASKYIKFLQAQVGILELMGSIQENEEPFHTQELQPLLASPLIQEKLYSAEKCLVPKHFVETLAANDRELQANPTIFKEINQLIPTTE